jgi:hypothetical protein
LLPRIWKHHPSVEHHVSAKSLFLQVFCREIGAQKQPKSWPKTLHRA